MSFTTPFGSYFSFSTISLSVPDAMILAFIVFLVCWRLKFRNNSTLKTTLKGLLFLYVGVIALWHAFDDRRLAGRAAGILVLIGVVNLPIIHYSVEWWNTLHQGSTRMQQSIDPAMRSPLRWSIFGFLLLSATLTLMRMRNLILLMEKRRPWVSELILKRGRK